MPQERVGQRAGDHRLADWHGADADARVVAALGDDLRFVAGLSDCAARRQDRRRALCRACHRSARPTPPARGALRDGRDCFAPRRRNRAEGRSNRMMRQSLLRRYWPLLSPAAILVILLAAGAYVVATLPPRAIVMATGPEGGANYGLGARYRQIFTQSGVELKLLPTSGSLENLRLLRDPKSGVSAGLLQGGAAEGAETSGVESLGTVGYEPLWLFRSHGIGGTLGALAGQRVSIGPEGSGA